MSVRKRFFSSRGAPLFRHLSFGHIEHEGDAVRTRFRGSPPRPVRGIRLPSFLAKENTPFRTLGRFRSSSFPLQPAHRGRAIGAAS